MDYSGLSPNGVQTYKINRPLTEEEQKNRLDPKRVASDEPMDWLSLIKVNSTYMELVDRWYHGKGALLWLSGSACLAGSFSALFFPYLVLTQKHIGLADVGFLLLTLLLSSGMAIIAGWVTRFELFRSTHYPIRLNRKTRKVYFLKPGGDLLEADWDKLFFCTQVNKQPAMTGDSMDVRAHLLADDGITVLDTFALACSEFKRPDVLSSVWEFVRRYMEEPDGVAKSCEERTLCLPIDGRREGLVFGIFRPYAFMVNHPIAQLLTSLMATLEVFGRWLCMYTSKVPVWPEKVEQACVIEPNDPHRCDWRDNKPFTFLEIGWPIVCVCISSVILCGIPIWLISLMMGD